MGWQCIEADVAAFEDVLTVPLRPMSREAVALAMRQEAGRWGCKPGKISDRWHWAHGSVTLAQEMLQSCEPGSLMVLEPCVAVPAVTGACIAGQIDVIVRIAVPAGTGIPQSALVRVRGIRRGHATRWPRESEETARSNEQFYGSATAVLPAARDVRLAIDPVARPALLP